MQARLERKFRAAIAGKTRVERAVRVVATHRDLILIRVIRSVSEDDDFSIGLEDHVGEIAIEIKLPGAQSVRRDSRVCEGRIEAAVCIQPRECCLSGEHAVWAG